MIVKHRLRKSIPEESLLEACVGLTCAEIGKKLGYSEPPVKRELTRLRELGRVRGEGKIQVRYYRT